MKMSEVTMSRQVINLKETEMSRTVRRKNSSRRHGRGGHYIPDGFKTAGYYTVYEGGWYEEKTYHAPATKRDRFKIWRSLHGESSNGNAFSPGREYRNARMRENRSINKQELVRWMKNPDGYEPMFEANPRSCWWDWS